VNEDKASRYHRLQRRAAVSGTVVAAVWLLLLLVTGWSIALRDMAAAAAGYAFVPTIIYYVVLVAVLTEAVQVPVAFYQGVILEQRYGMSAQSARGWWSDRLKSGVVAVLLAVVGAVIVWSLLRWSPSYWWVAASACFVAILVLLVRIGPVLLLPSFYTQKPLRRPALGVRIARLAERAGAGALAVFEWQLGSKTRRANAVLAGIGTTRRILLSDTLLAEHSDDEIEVVLAHELAHHVHHDIWKAIALEAGLIVLGFYLADLTLGAAVGHFGLSSVDDIAGLPLLVLTGGAVSLALVPLVHALSRAHERRADRYALNLTGNPDAFMSAIRRLSRQNLAEERPSRLVEILFCSHPPVAERLEAARAWPPGRADPCGPRESS
jgi:STE24 endopeptidase